MSERPDEPGAFTRSDRVAVARLFRVSGAYALKCQCTHALVGWVVGPDDQELSVLSRTTRPTSRDSLVGAFSESTIAQTDRVTSHTRSIRSALEERSVSSTGSSPSMRTRTTLLSSCCIGPWWSSRRAESAGRVDLQTRRGTHALKRFRTSGPMHLSASTLSVRGSSPGRPQQQPTCPGHGPQRGAEAS